MTSNISDAEMSVLAKIIETKAGIQNLAQKSRRRNIVILRRVFYRILRDHNVTYHAMGSFLQQDHAIAIHACKMFEVDVKYDPWVVDFYSECSSAFGQLINPNANKPQGVDEGTYEDMYNSAMVDIEVLNTIIASQASLINNLKAGLASAQRVSHKFTGIFSMIATKCPEGKENELYNRVQLILNEEFNGKKG